MAWWSWGYDCVVAGRTGWNPATAPNPQPYDAQPTSFPAGVDIVHVACSEQAGAACSSTGDVYVWGNMDIGGLGNGTQFGDQFWPTSASGYYASGVVNPPTRLTYAQASNAVEVTLTNVGTFWRKSDGTVWGVGFNASGEFGLGIRGNYYGSPVQLTGLPSGITHIRATTFWGYGLYAVDSIGRLWYAGGIAENPLGPGMGSGFTDSDTYHKTHDLVPNMVPYGQVKDAALAYRSSGGSSSGYCFYVLMADGTVMWWGKSMLAPSSANNPPTVLTGVTGISQIFGTWGSSTIYFLTTTGQVLGLGSDHNGALCNGTWSGSPYHSTYTSVDHNALPPVTITLPGGRSAARLVDGSSNTFAAFALTPAGEVWGWGQNDWLWGNSDPNSPGSGPPVAPPYPVFPDVFNGTRTTTDNITVMAGQALFVNATEVLTAIPARLATIVG